ncbi:hypothetical protein PHLGIDRAFT_130046 [Phlebiopsis gigantea 11061_1 CR5-6]|uniref:Uncharacterized protein n=1 Tax=Phlebiopsis gigantea (strain 11061_1 CR5-6) TaxID=745531 RepID=A0A0C3RSX2_PHLG1|nr:hypothetical protein PHLGIDRAFT_130046 [Phlebiopsis gigantea 11061_1 CR5-6]
MSLATFDAQNNPRQMHAVPALAPATLPASRVAVLPLSTAFAQNGSFLLVPHTLLPAPNVVLSSEPPYTVSCPPSPTDHISNHALMAETPHTDSRHNRYAYRGTHERQIIIAPQPISGSSRTVASTSFTQFTPTDALGLDIRPQRLFTHYHDDGFPSTLSQGAGPSLEPPQSRWSHRLRRLAPPPIQVPLPSRFSWTSTPNSPASSSENGKAAHASEPPAPAPASHPPSPPSSHRGAQSQCSTRRAPSGAVQSSASGSLLLQTMPFEDRIERAATIYAGPEVGVDADAPQPSPPQHPPPVVQRTIPLPPITPRSAGYAWYPVAGPSSRPLETGEPSSSGLQGRWPSPVLDRTQVESADVDSIAQDGLWPLYFSFEREPGVDWEASTARCIEAVEDMGYVLRSCALISLNETNSLIESLSGALRTIKSMMQTAPTSVVDLEEFHGQVWSQKYSTVLSSLTRNLDTLYLLADHLRDRPPRINKIVVVLEKLWRFVEKFEDLGRRLQIFHEHFGVLTLRAQLQELRVTAEAELAAERARRRSFEQTRAQARAERHQVRDELRRAKEAAQMHRDRWGSVRVRHGAVSDRAHSAGV